MSNLVKAYAVQSPKGLLEPFTYEAAALAPHEVRVKVKYCGICHSDMSMINNEWGLSQYPLVPGHEVIGTVSEVGSDVTSHQVGEVVGIGWQSGSCAHCDYCNRGKQHLCSQERATIVYRHGGWAESLAVDASFAVHVPEALNIPEAAPLMCAGNTVFSPILHYGVKPNMNVAVVGIGGLGHLAVQFLSKWGCDVTAISSTHSKDDEARALGASHFIATKGTDELKKAANKFDFIISTVSADLPWADYIGALRPEGNLVIVGVPENTVNIPAFGLIEREKRVSGGRASSPVDIAAMLDFAARKGVKAVSEVYPLADVNAALARMKEGKVRYRAVLTVS